MAIEAGSIVAVKTGGPKMTVQWAKDKSANCVWFDQENKHHAQMFAIAALKEVEHS